jgi:transcriptional regulator with XRE-family HTH domain
MANIGDRIRRLREQAGMSQEELANRLGVARPTVSQMENGQRKVSADDLTKLCSILQVPADVLLGIQGEPVVSIQKGRKKRKKRASLRISVPQRNMEKLKQVVLYILNQIGSKPNVGLTVLYKLLYFIDFDFYEKYEEQLIGATYIKNRFGPTPVEFKKIADRMVKDKEITRVRNECFRYPQTKYLPLVPPDLSGLKANELATINLVLSRLSDMTAKQVSEYSHRDVPWLSAEEGEPIEYESVFYRTPEYSVRHEDEQVSDGS